MIIWPNKYGCQLQADAEEQRKNPNVNVGAVCLPLDFDVNDLAFCGGNAYDVCEHSDCDFGVP